MYLVSSTIWTTLQLHIGGWSRECIECDRMHSVHPVSQKCTLHPTAGMQCTACNWNTAGMQCTACNWNAFHSSVHYILDCRSPQSGKTWLFGCSIARERLHCISSLHPVLHCCIHQCHTLHCSALFCLNWSESTRLQNSALFQPFQQAAVYFKCSHTLCVRFFLWYFSTFVSAFIAVKSSEREDFGNLVSIQQTEIAVQCNRVD